MQRTDEWERVYDRARQVFPDNDAPLSGIIDCVGTISGHGNEIHFQPHGRAIEEYADWPAFFAGTRAWPDHVGVVIDDAVTGDGYDADLDGVFVISFGEMRDPEWNASDPIVAAVLIHLSVQVRCRAGDHVPSAARAMLPEALREDIALIDILDVKADTE